jgi:hypothetical protein
MLTITPLMQSTMKERSADMTSHGMSLDVSVSSKKKIKK